MSNIERKDVTVQRFMYTSDDGHKCGAGRLLSAITILTESEKSDNFIANEDVTELLKTGGYVEEISDHRYRVIDSRKEDLIALGNKVSEAIGNEMEALPVNTEVVLAPTIKIMTDPSQSYENEETK